MNYIRHYGVKGQRWGVRRYQNPDGTLTAKGRKRYRNDVITSSAKIVTKEAENIKNGRKTNAYEVALKAIEKSADAYSKTGKIESGRMTPEEHLRFANAKAKHDAQRDEKRRKKMIENYVERYNKSADAINKDIVVINAKWDRIFGNIKDVTQHPRYDEYVAEINESVDKWDKIYGL